MPFTGACVPGRKIFVDANGMFHACERINSAFPLGDIYEGLNFEKISNLIIDYINHMDKCPDCEVKRRCTQCFQKFATDAGFSYSSKICNGIESSMKAAFIKTFSIAETNLKIIEEFTTKYKDIKKFYEG